MTGFLLAYTLKGIRGACDALTKEVKELALENEKLRSFINLETLHKQTQIDTLRLEMQRYEAKFNNFKKHGSQKEVH